MTTEPNKAEVDRLVSRTYRELGTEKASEHLNRAILQKAAAEGTRRARNPFLFAAWMKPVAWAATIGLGLAIVLELTQTPTAPVQETEMPAVGTEEAIPKDLDILSIESKGAARMTSQPGPSAERYVAEQQADSDLGAACDPETRASADDWMECIRNLRETGAIEPADLEYEAFVRLYPAERTADK